MMTEDNNIMNIKKIKNIFFAAVASVICIAAANQPITS